MSTLVERLTAGRHPVELVVRPERTVEAFKKCLERGYVHVKFTNTQGGTELGVRVDPADPAFKGVDLNATGVQVTITGSLVLDYVPVKCFAIVNLSSMKGEGWLESQPA